MPPHGAAAHAAKPVHEMGHATSLEKQCAPGQYGQDLPTASRKRCCHKEVDKRKCDSRLSCQFAPEGAVENRREQSLQFYLNAVLIFFN